MRRLMLLLPLVILAGGCTTTIPADFQTAADREVDFASLDRFAVIHSTTGEAYSRVLARQTANALQTFAARRGYQPYAEQQPLRVSRDSNTTILQLGASARQAFTRAGYTHHGRDPKFVISIEFAHGPFDYHVPGRIAMNESEDGKPAGHDERIYAHGVLVHVYDVRRRDQPIWTGTAVAVNTIEDVTRVAPALLDELARIYPAAVPPDRRTIHLP